MKVLVFRMSSLGDLILSTSFLESLPEEVIVDWVISKDFAFVLKNHPRIRHLIEFDKSSGLRGWVQLIRRLAHEEYDSRVDLHVTLRTQLARILFHWFDLSRGIWVPWLQLSKQRFRFYGLIFFKKFWPQEFRPTPIWKRFAGVAQSLVRWMPTTVSVFKPPRMEFLIPEGLADLGRFRLVSKQYFVVMPSSRWKSKEWNAQDYLEVCRKLSSSLRLIPVVMGQSRDENALTLTQLLNKAGIDSRSILDENDFRITATVVQNAAFYLGSDTGLAHLSEALGVKAYMIFGPTHPDLGFGPWLDSSRAIHSGIGCSPCSKDGRFCFRFDDPYACLKSITPSQVRGVIS